MSDCSSFSSSGFSTPDSSDAGTEGTAYAWEFVTTRQLKGPWHKMTWRISIDGGPWKEEEDLKLQKMAQIFEGDIDKAIKVLEAKGDADSCCEEQEIQKLKAENEKLSDEVNVLRSANAMRLRTEKQASASEVQEIDKLKAEKGKLLNEVNVLRCEKAMCKAMRVQESLGLEKQASTRQQTAINEAARVLEAKPDANSGCEEQEILILKAENEKLSEEVNSLKLENSMRIDYQASARQQTAIKRVVELWGTEHCTGASPKIVDGLDKAIKDLDRKHNEYSCCDMKAIEIGKLRNEVRNWDDVCESKTREIEKLKRDNRRNLEEVLTSKLEVQYLKENARIRELEEKAGVGEFRNKSLQLADAVELQQKVDKELADMEFKIYSLALVILSLVLLCISVSICIWGGINPVIRILAPPISVGLSILTCGLAICCHGMVERQSQAAKKRLLKSGALPKRKA